MLLAPRGGERLLKIAAGNFVGREFFGDVAATQAGLADFRTRIEMSKRALAEKELAYDFDGVPTDQNQCVGFIHQSGRLPRRVLVTLKDGVFQRQKGLWSCGPRLIRPRMRLCGRKTTLLEGILQDLP